uniref:Uncharacterized protein n=1 Tax=Arundo donax TaxID=35708 RepID=A0A0A8XUI4_ARUDO
MAVGSGPPSLWAHRNCPTAVGYSASMASVRRGVGDDDWGGPPRSASYATAGSSVRIAIAMAGCCVFLWLPSISHSYLLGYRSLDNEAVDPRRWGPNPTVSSVVPPTRRGLHARWRCATAARAGLPRTMAAPLAGSKWVGVECGQIHPSLTGSMWNELRAAGSTASSQDLCETISCGRIRPSHPRAWPSSVPTGLGKPPMHLPLSSPPPPVTPTTTSHLTTPMLQWISTSPARQSLSYARCSAPRLFVDLQQDKPPRPTQIPPPLPSSPSSSTSPLSSPSSPSSHPPPQAHRRPSPIGSVRHCPHRHHPRLRPPQSLSVHGSLASPSSCHASCCCHPSPRRCRSRVHRRSHAAALPKVVAASLKVVIVVRGRYRSRRSPPNCQRLWSPLEVVVDVRDRCRITEGRRHLTPCPRIPLLRSSVLVGPWLTGRSTSVLPA